MRRFARWSITHTATAKLILLPTAIIMIVCFYGCLAWTIAISASASRLVPDYRFSGLLNYRRLFASLRWDTAYSNLFLFGVSFILISLLLGISLAIALDRKLRGEAIFRGVFLYPMSLSYIVTGLAWQWLFNPTLGLQEVVPHHGLFSFRCDWIANQEWAIYTIAIAAAWHAAGLVMALTLANLHGIDPDIWRAARIDGVHPLRTYWYIVLPMIRTGILTAVILLIEIVMKTYDLVIAMTGGGPGGATDLPSLFIVDFSFHRASLGVAAAGAVVMLSSVCAAAAPFLYWSRRTA